LFQNNVVDDITLADNAARPVVTSQAQLRRIGGDNYAVITAMFTKPQAASISRQRVGRFHPDTVVPALQGASPSVTYTPGRI
jgi:hypothetical protein